MGLHDLARFDEFESEFSQLRMDSGTHPESIARIAAWTGQNDLAFQYMERTVGREGPQVAQSFNTDLYEPIKSDPRWQAFLERYNAAEADLTNVRFNPRLPSEVEQALAATE